jgi:hypothetical protein
MTAADDRAKMLDWLEKHCPSNIEYDFWFYFYDDLDDCFDGLEPWDLFGGPEYGEKAWHTWDQPFTGRLIPPPQQEETACPPR